MRIKGFYKQIQKPRPDLGRTSDENPPAKRLVIPALEFAKSVTETSSKVRERKTYNKEINDCIHGNR